MRYRLGLDVGTNSLGWAILLLDRELEPIEITDMGVRIFSDGRDTKTFASLKADRRLTRSASRRRDRFLRRQKKLINALVRHGLMPPDSQERKKLEHCDPYIIRKQAVEMECVPHHIGRALFHLNQRRGFKSNRKTADKETGKVNQSIKLLKEELKASKSPTLGHFLAKRNCKGESVRARPHADGKLYDLYPNRALYEEEFDKIWEKQQVFRPDLYSNKARDEIKEIIFHQRKLKPQKPGLCSLIQGESRMAKALPSFQRFRIIQELINLEWKDGWNQSHKVIHDKPLFDQLLKELEHKKTFKFSSIAKLMKKLNITDEDVEFNLESERREALVGNVVSCAMRSDKAIGEQWDEWSDERQDELIQLVINDELEDEEVAIRLIEEFDIPEDKIDAVLSAPLPPGYGHLSKAAIDKILPVMTDQGLAYWEAVREAGLGNHNLYDPNRPLSNELAYYGKILTTDVQPGSGDKNDGFEKQYGAIPNPTVHIALNQIRQVVNELIRRFGKPDQIVIELARELPAGPDGRREIKKFQADRQSENQRIAKELESQNKENNRLNRVKFQLWEELSTDPTQRRCVFTGKVISKGDLFSNAIEIEHLLPHSRTLDDSMANKTVCYLQANRDKGNRSPYEAFGHLPQWQDILTRSQKLPKNKRWRFDENAMQRYEQEEAGFVERQLNDTRYISRYTKKYLASIVPEINIWVVTGQLTAMLRGHWGLNSVLRGDNTPEEEQNRKLRDDHRHHAIDAVVIAMISRSMLQKVAKASRRGEDLHLEKLFEDSKQIDPWPNFRADVMSSIANLIVSHRTRKKNQGPLHNDTAYGFVKGQDGQAVHRVNISKFTKYTDLEKIRDDDIRSELQEVTKGRSGKDFETAMFNWCNNRDYPIRSLRIIEPVTLIPIKDKNGRVYKGFKGDGNAYMDIFANDSGKWQGEVISRFDANQKGFIPHWQKTYPTRKRIMQLRQNDTVRIEENGVQKLMRVQKLSQGIITLAPLNAANADARNRDKSDPFKFTSKSPSSLQKAKGCKMHVSPTGMIRPAE